MIGVLLALMTVGCGGNDPGTETEPIDPAAYETGETLYGQFCASCHATDGSGGVGPALSDGRAAERVGGVPEISTVIADGGDRMPGLGSRLTAEQIESIALYVQDRL